MKIILIDGPDGAGKSTIALNVVRHLERYGVKTKYVHFPNYESDIGAHIKKLLYGELGNFADMNPYVVHGLYAADRYEWFKRNSEKYKDYVLVLDRYILSSRVYQAACYLYHFHKDAFKESDYTDTTMEKIKDFLAIDKEFKVFDAHLLNLEVNRMRLPNPDITIWITADKQVLEDRKRNEDRQAMDNYETNEIFNNLVYCMGELISNEDDDSIAKIDNSKALDDTMDEVMKFIDTRLTLSLSNLEYEVNRGEKIEARKVNDEYFSSHLTFPI